MTKEESLHQFSPTPIIVKKSSRVSHFLVSKLCSDFDYIVSPFFLTLFQKKRFQKRKETLVRVKFQNLTLSQPL